MTPNCGSSRVYDSFVCSHELFPPGLSRVALMCRFVPGLIVSCYAMFSDYPREAQFFFLKGNRELLGEGGTGGREEGKTVVRIYRR